MGSDVHGITIPYFRGRFQSTLPAWGATRFLNLGKGIIIISIHAPRMGSDIRLMATLYHFQDFNPRSPHGERPDGVINPVSNSDFNPRSPHGERHVYRDVMAALKHISIHAPRMGSDKKIF